MPKCANFSSSPQLLALDYRSSSYVPQTFNHLKIPILAILAVTFSTLSNLFSNETHTSSSFQLICNHSNVCVISNLIFSYKNTRIEASLNLQQYITYLFMHTLNCTYIYKKEKYHLKSELSQITTETVLSYVLARRSRLVSRRRQGENKNVCVQLYTRENSLMVLLRGYTVIQVGPKYPSLSLI